MGSCPVQIISFKDSSPNIFKEMMTSFEMPDEFEEKPRILIFACENDALPVFDMAALERLKINTNVRIMPMRCLGGLNLVYINDALSSGSVLHSNSSSSHQPSPSVSLTYTRGGKMSKSTL